MFTEKYELPLLLEPLVIIPELVVIVPCLELLQVVAGHSGRCRDKLAESEEVLVALTAYMLSDVPEVHNLSLKCIIQVADSPQSCVRMVDSGITLRQLAVLRTLADNSTDYDRVRSLFKKHSWTTWRKREEEFNDYQFNPNARESEKYKESGNELFKQEKYLDAISRYTHAIEVVPFTAPQKKSDTWWSLPAVLYSNRAQCYLKIEDWASAAKDCTFAVSRCLTEDEHAHKILIKTVYRRAKAFSAKREVICCLNDAAMQLRQTTPAKLDSDCYTVYREVGMAKLRQL
jgi:tetratricopeptide (TPR) repeat protein